MKSSTAGHARQIWDDIRNGIFSVEMLAMINLEKLRYLATRDKTYIDMRNSSSAEVLKLIEKLQSVPDLVVPEMSAIVQEMPLSVQSFLFDRFLYVDEYLEKLGQTEFFFEEGPHEFLRWGLMDIWDSRERVGDWR